mmetsp:Transcript_90823/g.228435  ORF Transcript_90823/g.228435 Transcript_90823/m.228435 type:complete len:206 (+) Transcript_90823:853-1470(+)
MLLEGVQQHLTVVDAPQAFDQGMNVSPREDLLQGEVRVLRLEGRPQCFLDLRRFLAQPPLQPAPGRHPPRGQRLAHGRRAGGLQAYVPGSCMPLLVCPQGVLLVTPGEPQRLFPGQPEDTAQCRQPKLLAAGHAGEVACLRRLQDADRRPRVQEHQDLQDLVVVDEAGHCACPTTGGAGPSVGRGGAASGGPALREGARSIDDTA